MDVGNPSNFVRMLELFNGEFQSLAHTLSSYSITDEETVNTIRDLDSVHHYLADPHGAVAYLALKRWLEKNPGNQGIFLETAHPVKFYDGVEPIVHKKISLPESVSSLLHKKKTSLTMAPDYKSFREYLQTIK